MSLGTGRGMCVGTLSLCTPSAFLLPASPSLGIGYPPHPAPRLTCPIWQAAADAALPLQQLRVASTGLHAQGAAALLMSLRRLPSLTSIDLSDNPLTLKESRANAAEGTVGGSSDGSEVASHPE